MASAFERSALAAGFSPTLLRAILRRQQQVRVEHAKRSRAERIPAQPRRIEARFQLLTTRVSDRFAEDLWRRLEPVLKRAEARAEAARRGARQDAKELDEDAEELAAILEGAHAKVGEAERALDVAGELRRIGEDLHGWNAHELARVLGISLDDIVDDPAALRDFRERAAKLIRSIPEQHLERVKALIEEAHSSGMRVETLRKRLQAELGISKRRAELIARDQVLKANAEITRQRQIAAGVTRYEWDTSQDERVRAEHRALHGQVFMWDTPPVTNKKGDRNHPGTDFQCRCVAIPVFDDDAAATPVQSTTPFGTDEPAPPPPPALPPAEETPAEETTEAPPSKKRKKKRKKPDDERRPKRRPAEEASPPVEAPPPAETPEVPAAPEVPPIEEPVRERIEEPRLPEPAEAPREVVPPRHVEDPIPAIEEPVRPVLEEPELPTVDEPAPPRIEEPELPSAPSPQPTEPEDFGRIVLTPEQRAALPEIVEEVTRDPAAPVTPPRKVDPEPKMLDPEDIEATAHPGGRPKTTPKNRASLPRGWEPDQRPALEKAVKYIDEHPGGPMWPDGEPADGVLPPWVMSRGEDQGTYERKSVSQVQGEIDTHAVLVAEGNDVVVLKERPGQRNGDVLVNDAHVEIKTLSTATARGVRKRVVDSLKDEGQAPNIVIDLRTSPLRADDLPEIRREIERALRERKEGDGTLDFVRVFGQGFDVTWDLRHVL